MSDLLDFIFIVGLLGASIWDGFTTVYGTARILGDSGAATTASIVFGVLVLVFMLNSKAIVTGAGEKEELAGCIGKVLWFTAIGYDLYTSWVGNTRFIVGDASTPERTAVLIGITILVSGSPVLLSFRLSRSNS